MAVQDPPASKNTTPDVDIFDPVADGAPELPEVQPHAIEAAVEHQDQAPVPPAGDRGSQSFEGSGVPTDHDGRPFDPAIHEVEKDGKPRLSAAGKLRKKRGGGAKSQSRLNLDKGPQAAPGGPTPEAAALDLQIRQTAMVAAQMTFTLGMLVGGKEFLPIKDNKEHPGVDEPAEMLSGYETVFKAYGVVDLPPWASLAMVGIAYVSRRWHAEEFSKRRVSWWTKAKQWWIARSDRKAAEKKRREADRARRDEGTNRPTPSDISKAVSES